MRTKLAMVLLLLAFCATAGIAAEEYQWETIVRIKSPTDLWKSIASIEELQPVITACADRAWELLLGDHFVLPENFSVNEIMHIAIGRNKKRHNSISAVWSEKPDGTRVFLGAYSGFLSIFDKYQYEHPVASEGVVFPDVLAELDQSAIFHLRFLSENAVSDLTYALSAELMSEDKKLDYRCQENVRKLQRRLRKGEIAGLPAQGLPDCPLQGKYLFAAATKKFACSHQLKKPDLAAAKFEGYQQTAYDFLNMIQRLKSFSIKLGGAAEKLTVEIDVTGEAKTVSGNEFAIYAIPGWFEGVADLHDFSQSASMHLVLAPDFSRFINDFRRGDPQFFERVFADRKPEEFLPQGPIQLSLFGNLNLRGYSLPTVVISAGISPEKYAGLKDFAVSQGMPVQPQKVEIYGREVDLIEMPVERHAFNRQESDQRIFILSENAQRMAVCVGETAAREKLALLCGERLPVSLFPDIKLPVKLAFAYRADGLGQGLLEYVNSSAMQVEARECSKRLSEWRDANKEAFTRLSHGDKIPDDLARLCPRNGYFTADKNEYDKVGCAVHNYQALGEAQTRFIKAEVPAGRWLRGYIVKDGTKRRLTLDFYRPAEVK